jgi:hypothetical protein
MTTMMHQPQHSKGRRRPSLSEQINRLDNMLDGLSEGLNEAVADAVKIGIGTAAKEAVQAVLMEVFSNPELRARLVLPAEAVAKEAMPVATIAPSEAPTRVKRGWWQRVRACIGYMRSMCAGVCHAAGHAVSGAWYGTCEHFAAAWANCSILWPFKFQIIFALLIGVSVGIGVCHAEPWIAALASGFGGFVTTLTVQGGLWLRKVLATETQEMA